MRFDSLQMLTFVGPALELPQISDPTPEEVRCSVLRVLRCRRCNHLSISQAVEQMLRRITRFGEEVKTQQNYTELHRTHSKRFPKCSLVPQEICAWKVDKWHAKYTDALVPWLKDAESDLKV